MKKIRKRLLLGVNIDHVATVRQARLGTYPKPEEAAEEAVLGGADQITLHLREDRRHIQDRDLPAIRKSVSVPINLEMAINTEIAAIALKFRPEKVCIVPERRQELTTEGGLDAAANRAKLAQIIPQLKKKGIQVSLFLDPMEDQIREAARLGADAVEIHTGHYADLRGVEKKRELERISRAAQLAHERGLIVHAGHGLNLENVAALCRLPFIEELNIGHSIVARSILVGIRKAVREMKDKMKASA